MEDIGRLRAIHPLLASATATIDKRSDRIQDGFYDMGNQVLDLAYKETMFDDSMKIHADDSEEDNFDIVMNTAGKLRILRPVLRPDIIDPMLSAVCTRCIAVLGDTLNTICPIHGDQDKKSCEPVIAGQKNPKQFQLGCENGPRGRKLKNLRRPIQPTTQTWRSAQDKNNPKCRM